ncbi:MAG: hypothetical protein QOE41_2263 [Mycobacterium sp.]|nr:hypothetical protein [Mycobacterium sp.]
MNYDHADCVALRRQRAHELVKLAQQRRVDQVDRIVVDCHTGDPTVNLNVEALKIRKTHGKFDTGTLSWPALRFLRRRVDLALYG